MPNQSKSSSSKSKSDTSKSKSTKTNQTSKSNQEGRGLISYIKQKMHERDIRKQKQEEAENIIRQEQIKKYQEKIKLIQQRIAK